MADETPPENIEIDFASLKGLAHPLRVKILDVLSVYGPHTASGLADRLGETSGATSYHLRQLERHGFVQEVADRGSGRERWWERRPGGINIEPRKLPQAARPASDLVMREWQRNRAELLDAFLLRGEDELPERWISATVSSTANLFLTDEQLRSLSAELLALVDGYVDRYRHQKHHPVPGSRPVQVQIDAFPVLDGVETPADDRPDVGGPTYSDDQKRGRS
ncbi:helix-turn-helix protein [Diaminobutyricimonas aerilata]|uniref:Helix-turn-helix protein n=1 Tax=Diaminobutyricimonas aerilata TaxID=1162967 RepID=A0A2M9CJ70_9MICO|nr:helix-turn-helix domain-containing protein [Diaminobutyricimonas aerilata]PJJ71953.1 helix-turn-helix protein [Diaminobutyricimonas aerilata]